MTIILNLILILALPLLFIGVINKTKAFWSGRKGPSIFQPFYDFVRLFKKGMVISKTTSFVFLIFPGITFGTTFFASLLIPFALHSSVLNIEGAFIIFAYTMSLGKFFSIIGAMDTGSSFEGMGASREASFSTIVEPAFFIIMGSIIALTDIYNFDGFAMIISKAGSVGYLIVILGAITLFMIILIEGCRVPIDDPNTHLELTMIHEVMILDNSGPDLALLSYSSGMKMVAFASLIANLLIPTEIPLRISLLLFVGIIMAIAMAVGTTESAIARLRMSRVFDFIFFTSSLSLIILSFVAIGLYG